MRRIASWMIALSLAVGACAPAHALSAPGVGNIMCPDAGIFNELIGGVCWSAMFPIRIAGTNVISVGAGSPVPSEATTNSLCYCKGNIGKGQLPTIGIPIGFWQPAWLAEAVSAPFCMPAIGGVRIGGSSGMAQLFSGSLGGNVAARPGAGTQQASFYNVHLWTFPLVSMMNILNIPSCNTGYNGWNLFNLSETQPQWNDDLTAALIWPESSVLSGPVGFLGSIGECLALTAMQQPINSMYWTAGCWGTLFPNSGSLANNVDPIQGSSLDVAKFLSGQFRLGFGYLTEGDNAVCGAVHTEIMPKDQFRMQILYPNSEANNTVNPGVPQNVAQPSINPGTSSGQAPTTLSPAQSAAFSGQMHASGTCTHWIGETPLTWGEWDDQPGTGGNYVYLLWQYTDCCMGLFGNSTSP
jgi:conjugal transfer pilus assembly protein TraU